MTRPAIHDHFERRQRGDTDEWFYTLKDDAPEWLREAVYDAHNDEMPNDWVYDHLDTFARHIDSLDADADLEDISHEMADGNVDIYTHDLNRWYADNLGRSEWVEQAREEGLIDADADITARFSAGQYLQLRFIADTLVQAVIDNEEEDDE